MNQRKRHSKNGWEEFGGYMAARNKKLKNQFDKEQDLFCINEKRFFHGVCIYVDGYTDPPASVLRELMIKYGGKFKNKYRKKEVTHWVTEHLPRSKIDNLKNDIVVKPQWITDCVKAEKLLPCLDYRLYGDSSNQAISNVFMKDNFSNKNEVESANNCESTSVESTCANSPDLFSQSPTECKTLSPVYESGIVHDVTNDEDASVDNVSVHTIDSIASMSPLVLPKEKQVEDNTSQNEGGVMHCDTAKRQQEEEVYIKKSPPDEKKSLMKRAGEVGFLADFYANSRLHHLSSWATDLRDYVSELKQKIPADNGELLLKNASCSSALPARYDNDKIIMHLDMDCFFVSVGLRNRPDLKDKAVGVTHSKGTGSYENQNLNRKQELALFDKLYGNKSAREMPSKFHSMAEIASCSYKARQAGVKNGMLLGRAKELCPDLIPIPYDFEGYREVSEEMFKILVSYTHQLEVVSCDEAYLDVTELLARCPSVTPELLASRMRQEIFNKTKCTASVGIGKNPLVARLATKKAKPNGQCFLRGEELNQFLASMAVKDLPGVGYSMSKRLKEIGCQCCGHLQGLTLSHLQKEFGSKVGLKLYKSCRGEDSRQLEVEKERKSVSVEVNYGIRFVKRGEYEYFLTELSEEVSNRLKKARMKGRSISIKLMVRHPDAPRESSKFMGHGMCNHMNKCVTLPVATDDPRLIRQECVAMMRAWATPIEEIRGMGIHIQRLESADKSLVKEAKKPTGLLKFFKQQPVQIDKKENENEPASEVARTKPLPHQELEIFPDTNDDCNLSMISPIVRVNEAGPRETDCSFSASTPKLTLQNKGRLPDLPLPPKVYQQRLMLDRVVDNDDTSMEHKRIGRPSDIVEEEGEDSVVLHQIPPYSQVDQSVLNALPVDIRKELYPDICSQLPITSGASPQPGPSNLLPSGNREKRSLEELPSESQIDPSVFEALPPTVKLELRAALNLKKKENKADQNLKPVSISPLKVHNSKQGANIVRRGRGGGRGSSARLYDADTNRQMMLNFLIKEPGNLNDPPPVDCRKQSPSSKSTAVVNTGNNEAIEQTEELYLCHPSPDKSVKRHCTPLDKFRAKPWNEMKLLLDQWINSTPCPQSIDEDFFRKFLLSTLPTNLEIVQLALVKIRRSIARHMEQAPTVSDAWVSLFNNILHDVQADCKKNYRAKLDVQPL